METRLIVAWALIALLAAVAGFIAWRFATRHTRRNRPWARSMRERWLGL